MKELRSTKQDVRTLQAQLEVKDKSVANYRNETMNLRKEVIDLKREILEARGQHNECQQQLQAANEKIAALELAARQQ